MKVTRLVQELPAITVFILCLFGGGFESSSFDNVASVCREIEAIFKDAATQWMAVLCFGIYLVTFVAMRNRSHRGRLTPTGGIDFWRCVFFGASILFYFLDYRHASQSKQMLVLLGGAAVANGVWVNLFWHSEPGANSRSLWRFVMLAVVMLAMSCFWNFGSASVYSFKHNIRWMGPCDNPNLYGLLMGVGMILELGLVLCTTDVISALGLRWTFWKYLTGALALAASTVMCFGLWKSYSRGAWLGTGIGVLYLLIQWRKRHPKGPAAQIRARLMAVCIAFVFFGLLGLLFWQYRHTESLTVRRAISVSNENDLSWRNRVAAWEGSLQMVAEKPWLGLGWNQTEPFYGYYYSPWRLDETLAIRMNDYFMVGTTLGLPALLCFSIYLWLSLMESTRRGERLFTDLNDRRLEWLQAVCRAGAIALAVGFWFDGGLFNFPTAATFWILLELGRADRKVTQ